METFYYDDLQLYVAREQSQLSSAPDGDADGTAVASVEIRGLSAPGVDLIAVRDSLLKCFDGVAEAGCDVVRDEGSEVFAIALQAVAPAASAAAVAAALAEATRLVAEWQAAHEQAMRLAQVVFDAYCANRRAVKAL